MTSPPPHTHASLAQPDPCSGARPLRRSGYRTPRMTTLTTWTTWRTEPQAQESRPGPLLCGRTEPQAVRHGLGRSSAGGLGPRQQNPGSEARPESLVCGRPCRPSAVMAGRGPSSLPWLSPRADVNKQTQPPLLVRRCEQQCTCINHRRTQTLVAFQASSTPHAM